MDERVEYAIATMEARLHTSVTIAELASAAGLSVSQFGRVFRAATGMPPATYLQHLRMTRARILLERTSLSVADIMVKVGVSDPSHFARGFRRAHGFSPRALRQHLRAAGRSGLYAALWERTR
jgi:transcriptional regulator GlxA family with amidase domain